MRRFGKDSWRQDSPCENKCEVSTDWPGHCFNKPTVMPHSKNKPIRRKAGAKPEVALLIFDFDGVLTDNRVLVFQDGREAVLCSRADGLAFDLLRQWRVRTVIMSTETNPVVRARAAKLRVPVLQALMDKGKAVQDFSRKAGIALANVMFVGNDLNDLPAMQNVGYPVAVANAHPAVKKIAWKVLRTNGGEGVAREVVENLLKPRTEAPKHQRQPKRNE